MQAQTPTATAIAYPIDGSASMVPGSPNGNDLYSLGLENNSISNELDLGGNFFSQVRNNVLSIVSLSSSYDYPSIVGLYDCCSQSRKYSIRFNAREIT